jgi:hypothetical protein
MLTECGNQVLLSAAANYGEIVLTGAALPLMLIACLFLDKTLRTGNNLVTKPKRNESRHVYFLCIKSGIMKYGDHFVSIKIQFESHKVLHQGRQPFSSDVTKQCCKVIQRAKLGKYCKIYHRQNTTLF